MYRSGLEQKVAELLTSLKVKYEYESKKLGYIIEREYIPDFILPNGVLLEVKGYLKGDDRRKMVAVKKAHPEADIRFVFQAPNNKIYKGSKTTYAKWCEKHDFPWCSYTKIPVDWLK